MFCKRSACHHCMPLLQVVDREVAEQLRTYWISSNGQPTGGSPQAMRLGKVLKSRPRKEKETPCFEMLQRILGWLS
jgi:hypothetical protein